MRYAAPGLQNGPDQFRFSADDADLLLRGQTPRPKGQYTSSTCPSALGAYPTKSQSEDQYTQHRTGFQLELGFSYEGHPFAHLPV